MSITNNKAISTPHFLFHLFLSHHHLTFAPSASYQTTSKDGGSKTHRRHRSQRSRTHLLPTFNSDQTNNPQYLLFLTLLSAYSMHTARLHTLPIPRTLSAFTLALPLISGLIISSITTLPSSQPLLLKSKKPTRHPQWQNYALLLLTILSTVLATLSGTHLPSSATQTCTLDTKWQSMFSQHDGKSIQRIQDAFNCCGLHSIRDKAFPFPSKNIGVDACSKTFGRTKSCFNDWRGEEKKVAGLGLVVVFGVVLWEVCLLLLLSPYPHLFLPLFLSPLLFPFIFQERTNKNLTNPTLKDPNPSPLQIQKLNMVVPNPRHLHLTPRSREPNQRTQSHRSRRRWR